MLTHPKVDQALSSISNSDDGEADEALRRIMRNAAQIEGVWFEAEPVYVYVLGGPRINEARS